MAMERRRGLATGVLLGILGTMAAHTLLPFFIPLLRPLTKQGMKAAIHGYERSREVTAHLAEAASDIFAEVQEELQAEPNGAATEEARAIPITRKPADS